MFENNLEVKQSKKIVILGCCSAGIFVALFLGLFIFFSIKLFDAPTTSDELIVSIINLTFCVTFTIVVLIILIYIIYTYICQTDIYTGTKMYRKKGDKIIFELPYEQILSIREGYCSLFFVLQNGIIKSNGKKGPRNFYEHYSRADIHRIKHIITDKYYNIQIQ